MRRSSTLLTRSAPLPRCVFAVNDVMAVGALARLRTAGLSVPGDVAVAGFDDIITLRDVWPRLTTVRLPLTAMGEMAGRLALDQEQDEAPRLLPVPGEVILRESTALAERFGCIVSGPSVACGKRFPSNRRS